MRMHTSMCYLANITWLSRDIKSHMTIVDIIWHLYIYISTAECKKGLSIKIMFQWDFRWSGDQFFVFRGWKWLQGTYQNFIEKCQYLPYLMIYLRFWNFLGLLGLYLAWGPMFLYWGVENSCKEQHIKLSSKIVNIYPI